MINFIILIYTDSSKRSNLDMLINQWHCNAEDKYLPVVNIHNN
jgi:hypothetical protein